MNAITFVKCTLNVSLMLIIGRRSYIFASLCAKIFGEYQSKGLESGGEYSFFKKVKYKVWRLFD
jgi:hypothetical protein